MLVLDPFLRGLHEGEARVELIHLIDLTISPCQGDFECWFKTPGQCTLHDDMAVVLDKLKKADIWVFSTGVYWGGPSGLLKNAMDRMLPLVESFVDLQEGQSHNKLRQGTMPGKLVLVSSCAYWEMDNFDLVVAQMKSFCAQVDHEFAGALLRPHAFALPHMMSLGKETAHVREAARQAGRQLAKEGRMEKELLQAVSSKLMPRTVYIRHMSQESKKGLAAAAEGRRISSDDRLEVKTISHPFMFKSSQDGDLNNKIINAIHRMGGVGQRAEQEYQQSIETLRALAEKAGSVIAEEYEALPETSYLDRWSLVHLIAELGHPSSLQALGRILDSPIPSEKSKVLHEYSTRAEELMIRTTAIEAIKRVAERKSPEALDLLLKYVRHKEFSIRRAAVQSYMEVAGSDAREKLLEILPAENRGLLEIKRIDVRNVPQAVVFDSTSPPSKRDIPLPPRAPDLPHGRERPNDDTPRSGERWSQKPTEGGNKPCCD